MANLKELKNRISSVKNTQKITKAMKMVAASKLRKAQERAEESRPYSRKLSQVIQNLCETTPQANRPEFLSGRLDQRDNLIEKKVLLIITSSDKGLCGGFNTSLLKEGRKTINELTNQGKKVKILVVGKKGNDSLKVTHETLIIKKFLAAEGKQVEFSDANNIGKIAIDLFESGEVDTVKFLYSKFVNPLVQEVTLKSLIPLDVTDVDVEEEASNADSSSVYDYEPDEEEILKSLLPKNISVQIFRGMLENSASEQGARMTAMDNATKNASEMIHKLTLQYNRSRQAAITTELTEIVAGAEAV